MELCKCSHSSRAFVSNKKPILSNVNPRFVKVQIKVKVKVTLEQAMEAQRRKEAWLYSFFNLSARCGVCSTPRLDRFTPGKDLLPTV